MVLSSGMVRAGAGRGNGDWFDSRRDFFVRQAVRDALHLGSRFQQIYNHYRVEVLPGKLTDGCAPARERPVVYGELLSQFTSMVGTEKDTGPLWQLKDLCHQIWQPAHQGEYVHGVLFDWLIGSLFHECMKLKENLYLLSNYGAKTTTVENLIGLVNLCQSHRVAGAPLADVRILIGQIRGDFARQMERVGFLFGQMTYLLRLMVPVLVENRLIVRLLAEEEKILTDLWGESLEELFFGTFTGSASVGFCLAGESFFRGQWYQDSLKMYERALVADPLCQEALVRVAQVYAILGTTEGYRANAEQDASS